MTLKAQKRGWVSKLSKNGQHVALRLGVDGDSSRDATITAERGFSDTRAADSRTGQMQPHVAVEPRSGPDKVPTPWELPRTTVTRKKPGSPDVTLVSDMPHVAHATARSGQPGLSYYSRAVRDLTWSDGTVTWKCADCNKTAPGDFINPRGVANHWGKIHGAKFPGESEIATKRVFIDKRYTGRAFERARSAIVPSGDEYTPTEERVKSLAEWLQQTLESLLTNDPEDVAWALALAALGWEHDRKSDPTPREPLTDAEILQRIRRLVDEGHRGEQLAENDKLREELARAHAQLEEAENNLTSLVELATELKKKGK
jgi:hypothetical protein